MIGDEVTRTDWEAHVANKRLVRPRGDVYFHEEALAWELDDGSVVGYTVISRDGCPTCGPDLESMYYIRQS